MSASASSTPYFGQPGDLDLHALWKDVITAKPEWAELDVGKELDHIQAKIENDARFPTNGCIFRIFHLMEPSNISVVLLGQDPYIDLVEGQVDGKSVLVPRACGLSFSSPLGKIPLSLRTMFQEMIKTRGDIANLVETQREKEKKSGDLSYLVAEGVFLCNAFLTVKVNEGTMKGEPNSHGSWNVFMHKVLKFIKKKNPRVVWLALGDNAKYKMETSQITNYVFAPHPASVRFGRRGNSFLDSDVFNVVNNKLLEMGLKPIDWEPLDEKDTVDKIYFLS